MSYFQDGSHDVISRRKVLPPGDCMHTERMLGAYAAASASSSYRR